MKLETAIKKMEKAGAKVTSTTDNRNNVTTYSAKFENATIEFTTDNETDNVSCFSKSYGYDEGSQETMRSFYYTATSAIKSATR